MYRNEFPILKEKINGNDLIYFDNAATSQTPQKVINSIVEYYSKYNSNVHRGAHFLSNQATTKFEEARKVIANHFNMKAQNCIFTKGTTHSFNLFARSIEHLINQGDEIIIAEYEHHSNFVVMQELAKRREAILKIVPLNSDEEFDYVTFEQLLTPQTKLVSLGIISNVLGEKLDTKRIKQAMSFYEDALLCYDSAQMLGHQKIDMQELGCDVLMCSAHKGYGPMGVGCLIATENLIKKMNPSEFGGAMIQSVSSQETVYKENFEKLEAGTPDVCGVLAFKSAIEFIEGIGMQTIENHEKELVSYFFKKAQKIEGFEIIGTKNLSKKSGVISFQIKDKNSYDLATLLDMRGIAIREGAHCAQPLLKSLQLDSTLRVSFAIYNTIEEIDYFFESLELVLEML